MNYRKEKIGKILSGYCMLVALVAYSCFYVIPTGIFAFLAATFYDWFTGALISEATSLSYNVLMVMAGYITIAGIMVFSIFVGSMITCFLETYFGVDMVEYIPD